MGRFTGTMGKKTTAEPVAAEEQDEHTESQKKEKKKRKAVEADAEVEVAEKPKKQKKQKVETADDEADDAPKKKKKSDKEITQDEAQDEEGEDENMADAAESGQFRLHVSGLPFTTTKDELWTDFQEYGPITDVAILLDQGRKSRGIAFVTFESKKGMKAALKLNGDEYRGRTVKVSLATGEGERRSLAADNSALTKTKKKKSGGSFDVFVGGLPYKVEEADVRKLFDGCGEIGKWDMPLNTRGKRAGTTKGVAWISYTTRPAMYTALKLHGTEHFGRKLVVEKRGELLESGIKEDAQAGGEGKQSDKGKGAAKGDSGKGDVGKAKGKDEDKGKGKGKDKGKSKSKDKGKGSASRDFEVFIGGLPWDLKVEKVKTDFEECGEMSRFNMPLDEQGQHQGIAFVNFTTQGGWEKALAFHEQEYGGVQIRVLPSVKPRNPGNLRHEEAVAQKDGDGAGNGGTEETEKVDITSTADAEAAGKRVAFDSDSE